MNSLNKFTEFVIYSHHLNRLIKYILYVKNNYFKIIYLFIIEIQDWQILIIF